MAKPQCGSCRFYEDAKIAGSGWCHHPLRKTTSALIIMVRGNELACRDEWSRSLFEPGKFSREGLSGNEQAAPGQAQAVRPVQPATAPELAAVVNSSKVLTAPPSDAKPQDVVLDEGAIVTRYTRRFAPEQEALPPIHHETSIRNAIQRARENFRENSKLSRPDKDSPAVAVLETDESNSVTTDAQMVVTESSPNLVGADPVVPTTDMTDGLEDFQEADGAPEVSALADDDTDQGELASEPGTRENANNASGLTDEESRDLPRTGGERTSGSDVASQPKTPDRALPVDPVDAGLGTVSITRKPPVIVHESPWTVKRAREQFVDDREPWLEEPLPRPPVQPAVDDLAEEIRPNRERPRAARRGWEDIAPTAHHEEIPSARADAIGVPIQARTNDQDYTSGFAETETEPGEFVFPAPESSPWTDEWTETGDHARDDREIANERAGYSHDSPGDMHWEDAARYPDEPTRVVAGVSSFQVAPDAPRICRLCRDFRPTDQGDRGWCMNQWAFDQQRVVDANDQSPCESSVGSWWLPADDFWIGDLDFSAHGQATPLLNRWLPWLGTGDVEEGRKES